MIEAEADAQDVAAHVGDACPAHQLGAPALRVGHRGRRGSGHAARRPSGLSSSASPSARPGDAPRAAGAWRPATRAAIRAGRQAILLEHPLDGVEPVERRRIEGRAHEAHCVRWYSRRCCRAARSARRTRQPAGDRRPLAEARRAMHEPHALAGHRIFIAAAEVEGRCGDRRIDRRLDRHEGMIAVDHDPRAVGPGKRGELAQPGRTAGRC